MSESMTFRNMRQGATEDEAIRDARKNLAVMEESLGQQLAEEAQARAERPAIEEAGEAALHRLYALATNHHTSGGKIAANFLLSCYHGGRFPFDLSDFRVLDRGVFSDCIAVLKMDYQPRREVHEYFNDGENKFEALAEKYGFVDAKGSA